MSNRTGVAIGPRVGLRRTTDEGEYRVRWVA